jgi:hypothetical protein
MNAIFFTLLKESPALEEITVICCSQSCRAFRRLDEVINSLERASKAIGDIGLAALLNESGQCLRRGLPFAASLYI